MVFNMIHMKLLPHCSRCPDRIFKRMRHQLVAEQLIHLLQRLPFRFWKEEYIASGSTNVKSKKEIEKPEP